MRPSHQALVAIQRVWLLRRNGCRSRRRPALLETHPSPNRTTASGPGPAAGCAAYFSVYHNLQRCRIGCGLPADAPGKGRNPRKFLSHCPPVGLLEARLSKPAGKISEPQGQYRLPARCVQRGNRNYMAAYPQHHSNLLNHRAIPDDVDFHCRSRGHFGHHEIHLVRQTRPRRYVYARKRIEIYGYLLCLNSDGREDMQY